jgi:hypothetical protein
VRAPELLSVRGEGDTMFTIGVLWAGQLERRPIPPVLLTLALRDGARGAVRERAKHRPDLYMRPPPASRRGNVAFVELCGDGIEARCAGLLDLPDDRQHVGRKPPRVRLQRRRAAYCRLVQPRIA